MGLIVWDNFREQSWSEGIAHGADGPAKGREVEIAERLRCINTVGIRTTVWFTADVHYTVTHYSDPTQAQFSEFNPVWKSVSGPLRAGAFGPNALDDTFGPEVKFAKSPAEGLGINLPL